MRSWHRSVVDIVLIMFRPLCPSPSIPLSFSLGVNRVTAINQTSRFHDDGFHDCFDGFLQHGVSPALSKVLD